MKAESEPLTTDERLLRRVRAERFRTTRTPIVSPGAFEPRVKADEPDTDGISLYREQCLTSPADVLATVADDKRGLYAVVALPVVELLTLGVSVILRPRPPIPGHVEIPELRVETFLADRKGCQAIQERMAEIASRPESILIRPSEQ